MERAALLTTMAYNNGKVAQILRDLDFGSSVAELDGLLETARVETSVFSDLLRDRVDLVPGSKGSGKSALYRIFVEFLPDHLLKQRKIVVAHGVRPHGEDVFHIFEEKFAELSERDFVNFWCVYLVSLAHEHFIKDARYEQFLRDAKAEVAAFKRSCAAARIPEIEAKKSVRDVLAWALEAIPRPRPKIKYEANSNTFEVDLFGDVVNKRGEKEEEVPALPRYINEVKDSLESVLKKTRLHLWLMVDRLDEIFPRRSETETRALRGLLHCLKIFQSPSIRVKVFLRDDILEQVTEEGFAALTHITARQADNLKWNEEQILTLIVNRLFASEPLRELLDIEPERLKASREYQDEAFYRAFPPTVHPGSRQSTTLRWLYNHTKDGRGVVTPRDVIDLLTRAKQHQQDELDAAPEESSEYIIGSAERVNNIETPAWCI